jgi:hypothetical protein
LFAVGRSSIFSRRMAGPLVPNAVAAHGSAASVRRLGPEEHARLRESFANDGYVVLPGAIAASLAEQLRSDMLEAFERARRDGELPNGGGTMAGHLNLYPGAAARAVYQALYDYGVYDFAQSVLPRPLGQARLGCNFNMPKSIVQHYHTDSPFLDAFMIVNTAIVDTEVENGAIEVAPGTHKRFYRYWRFAAELRRRPGRRIPMRQGDVLVRVSTLWHRGMPNRTAAVRPMLAVTFDVQKRGQPVPPPKDPFLFNDGKPQFYENWYRPTVLGRMRERAFIAAPFTYDGLRFVRSLFSDAGYGVP